MKSTIVIHGDVDLILGEAWKVGGDEKLTLLLKDVAVEVKLIGEATDRVAVTEDHILHALQLWSEESTGDKHGYTWSVSILFSSGRAIRIRPRKAVVPDGIFITKKTKCIGNNEKYRKQRLLSKLCADLPFKTRLSS